LYVTGQPCCKSLCLDIIIIIVVRTVNATLLTWQFWPCYLYELLATNYK